VLIFLEKNDEGILGVSASKMEGWYEKLAFSHQYVAFFKTGTKHGYSYHRR